MTAADAAATPPVNGTDAAALPTAAPQPTRTDTSEHWVELRVHGVSGTPPEDIMLTGFVRQVAGDDRGRFFRPADSLGNEQQQQQGRVLEAYHWGRYTSGSWTQALWLLIVPFGIVNAAAFMLPPASTRLGSVARNVALAALRVIGLGLTCLLVFGSITVGMDLFGWQVMNAGLGGSRQWWLPVGALLPAGAIVLFYYFGRTGTPGQNPAFDQTDNLGLARAADGPPPTDLARDGFFDGDPDAGTLRRLHAATAALVTLTVLLAPAAAGGSGTAHAITLSCAALIGGCLLVVLLLGDPTQPDGFAGWHRLADRVVGALLPLVIAVAAAAVVVAGTAQLPVALATQAQIPGIATLALGLLTGTVAALVLLALAAAVLAVGSRRDGVGTSAGHAFRPYARRYAGFAVAAVGAFLGVGFAAAFCFAAKSALQPFTERPLTVTPILQRVAYAWGVTVLELVAVAVVIVVVRAGTRKTFLAAAEVAFSARPPLGLPPRWAATVASAMFLARLKTWLAPLFALFSAGGMALSAVAGWEQWRLARDLPGPLEVPGLGWLSGLDGEPGGWLIWVGTLALTGLSIALVVLGRGAIRAERARRAVNVVWDVVAFWPRAVHPFVPPPYSQHVVAGLRRRISWHLGTLNDPTAAPPEVPATRVVVAAHSQGSLITAAALLWLTPLERDRVGLVTFGSQLQRPFSAAFPSAMNLPTLQWIWKAYGQRWRNLYRDTDPIAGPVLSWAHRSVREPEAPVSDNFELPSNRATAAPVRDTVDPGTGRRSCGPDWRVLDPPLTDVAMMASPATALRAHSSYPADPDFATAVTAALPQAVPIVPPGT